MRKLRFVTLRSGICLFLIVLFNKGVIEASSQDEKTYPVGQFVLTYGKAYSDLPDVATWSDDLQVNLGVKESILVSPHEAEETTLITLNNLKSETLFSASGLKSVLEAIVTYWNEKDYYGVYAIFDSNQVDPKTGQDKRSQGDTTLTIITWFSQVNKVRTISNDTTEPDSTESNPHHSIIKGAPLSARNAESEGSLLQRRVLENYLRRLNRYPGRRVDVAVAPSEELGEILVNFLVKEPKPYIAYTQVSNTGTKSTGDWRERVGGIHYQLTGHDDILSIDFSTAELDRSNALLGSYELPILKPNYLKLRTYGSWSEFDSEEVGVSNLEFNGETLSFGAELTANPIVTEYYFIDLVGGLRWSDITVENETLNTNSEAEVLAPYTGIIIGNQSRIFNTNLSLTVEHNVHNISDTEMTSLGRLDTVDDWAAFKWDWRNSLFLDPLWFGDDWKDTSTWQSSTLAHELYLRFRGQHTFDNERVIPQEELIIGGFSSVRGYRESVAAGDEGFVVNAEYRYHVPRSLMPLSEVDHPEIKLFGKYNVRPPYVYGRPDWDLILRGFFDYGYAGINDKRPEDNSLTLISTGVGLELQLFTNFNIRLDWGYVLNTLERGGVILDDAEAGDSRFHFITTLSW